jgi:peptidyl-prolyl cis-trans isomerase A (cyclophilin A)
MTSCLALASRLLLAAGLAAAAGAAAAQSPSAAAAPRVLLTTTEGNITLELDAQKAPKTVANFLEYVKSGHYDGTIFHRVIDGFMIQGGGYGADLAQKPTRAPIPLESRSGLNNDRGTIAMARTGDPNSATSQFFINVVDNPGLNYTPPDGNDGYAVFGRVVEGMDVVDRIKAAPTTAKGVFQNLPGKPIVLKSATILK